MLRHLIILLSLYFVGFSNLHAQTFYVKAGGVGDGSSWANASGDIQAMLSQSTAGTQIWIAQGTYYPILCNTCTHSERDTPFEIPDGVAIYGGFNGTESALSQRDVSANPTILSGDIDQDGNNWNNAYSILYTKNVSAATIIDGFEITKGYADNASYDIYLRINSGAGLYNDGSVNGSSHPTIRNCKFTDHYGRGFGGAMMNYGGFGGSCSPEIYDCEFNDNESVNSGGAVFNSGVFSGQTATVFVNCTFKNNNSNNGGAIYNQASEDGSSAVTYNNCLFENNTATNWGGAIVEFGNRGTSFPNYDNCSFIGNSANLGGGILNDGSFEGTCNPVYKDCSWSNNFSNLGGGGVYSQGPFDGNAHPSFDRCTFTNNTTNASGAALYFNGQDGNSNPTISNSIFTQNTAGMYGGGMYNFGKSGHSNPVITNCLFVRNKGAAAGSIYNYGGVNGESSPQITNCTFFKNEADVGPCVYNQAADPTGTVRPVVTNCIFWKNISTSGFGLVFQNGYAQPTISHSLFPLPDCTELNTDPNSTVTCGSGLLFNVDPLFINEAFENLHLEETSPAKDIGDNAAINATGINIDLDNATRVFNGVVDLGVYEYQSNYQAPSIFAQSNSNTYCAGETETLFVVPAGTPPFTYQWKKDGININGATDSTLVFISLTTSDDADYTCSATSSMADVAESEVISLTVNPLLEVSIDIAASTQTICAGETITFTSTSSNEGNVPVYNWLVNGQGVGNNQNQLQLNNLNDGDMVTCTLVSSESCTTGSTANSNSIEISVAEILAVDIDIQASSQSICQGESVDFTINAQNPGTDPVYLWYLNSQLIPGSGESIVLSNLNDGDQISCELQSSENCTSNNPAFSPVITIAVTPLLQPEIMIDASVTSICEGEEVIFQATTNNEGNDPEFSWYLNNILIPNTGDQLILDTLKDGDQVTCELMSSYACPQENPVNSNSIEIQVQMFAEAEVYLEPSEIVICAGETVALEAITAYGGANPEFVWFVNGIPSGTNTPLYTWDNAVDGDEISVMMVSSRNCIVEDTVNASPVIISVNEVLEVSVSIDAPALSICQGEEVRILADVENGAADDVYQWLVNGMDQNVDSSVFITNSLADGDVVQCQLNSMLDCVAQSPVISNSIIFKVNENVMSAIDIAVNETVVCIGDTLSFIASTSNGGSDPSYEWTLDGMTTVGENAPVLSLTDLPLGTYMVECGLTSSEECITENPITSDPISIEVINTGICQLANSDLVNENQIKIFPNPSLDGRFFLQLEGDFKDLTLEVRDIQGRLVLQESGIDVNQKREIPFQVQGQAKGLYFVQLIGEEGRSTYKLIVQ